MRTDALNVKRLAQPGGFRHYRAMANEKNADRDERLAKALRDNLRRRKMPGKTLPKTQEASEDRRLSDTDASA
jgi:ribosomal protein L39E